MAVAAGAAVAVASVTAVALSRRDATAVDSGHAPSVAAVTLPGSPGRVSDAAALLRKAGPPLPATAAAAPNDAVLRFLTATVKRDAAASYALLATASRTRYASVAQWQQAQTGSPRPSAVALVGTARPVVGGVAVRVRVTQPATLDVFHGYVAAVETRTYLAVREGGGWRVSAAPLATAAQLPAESGVTTTARAWVERRVACDAKGSAALQAAGSGLLGEPDLALAPCEVKGNWTAGAPQRLEIGPATSTFLAAYGDGVASWARAVPVTGPHGRFLAVLGPLGSGWRVTGVIPDGAGS